LQAQQREKFIQERYAKYNLSDPFMALQRDYEALKEEHDATATTCPSPLSVLKVVMSHCKKMHEKMVAQLAAAESRHRKVIMDLEEEKRRHAQDTADGDDVTYMLEKERERLAQQLDFEKSQIKKLEKDQKKLSGQLEEERAHHKQLSSTLVKECKKATAKAAEESQRTTDLSAKLELEKSVVQRLQTELEAERKRCLQMEAQAEKQLSEFDTELEQLRARLKREEIRARGLEEEVECLKKSIVCPPGEVKPLGQYCSMAAASMKSTACQTDSSIMESEKSSKLSTPVTQQAKVNGHCASQPPSVSPSSTASSSLTSSPCSSPVLAKRLVGVSASSPGYLSSYQAGINQRFHAARHKFQAQAEQEQQASSAPHSPRDLSPTTVDGCATSSVAKQMARNTVTQVLSRFTKPASSNSSPFGTDYRALAAVTSPTTSRTSGPLSPGIKSPTIPRAERGIPPPIPPKKPGLTQSPVSPSSPSKSTQIAPVLVPGGDLPGGCGLRASPVELNKDLDMVMPTGS
ncbi:CT2NL protein, partial [Polypterus senegalus]|nr:CT2NL protein [Polypterus senegalus]